MKKTLVFIPLLIVTLFTLAQITPPELTPPPDIPTSLFGCLPTDTLRQCILKLLGVVLRLILVVALALAAGFGAWAGVTYITGGSDDKKREASKNSLIYAAVGLVIAFLAWAITFLLSRFVSQPQI